MVLKRVEYAIFESDAGALESAERGEDHEIDRELQLHFGDGSVHFVSWCQAPTDYCVCVANNSFFLPSPPMLVDGSGFPAWAPLIGCDVVLDYVDSERQVIRVSSESSAVILASREGPNWGVDVLHISIQPQGPDV